MAMSRMSGPDTVRLDFGALAKKLMGRKGMEHAIQKWLIWWFV